MNNIPSGQEEVVFEDPNDNQGECIQFSFYEISFSM